MNKWAAGVALAVAQETGWRRSDVYRWLAAGDQRGVPRAWLEATARAWAAGRLYGESFLDTVARFAERGGGAAR